MTLPRHLSRFKERITPLPILRQLRKLLDERGFAQVSLDDLYQDILCELTPDEIMAGYAFPPEVLPLLQEAMQRLEKSVAAHRNQEPID